MCHVCAGDLPEIGTRRIISDKHKFLKSIVLTICQRGSPLKLSSVLKPRKVYKEHVIQTPLDFSQLLPIKYDNETKHLLHLFGSDM